MVTRKEVLKNTLIYYSGEIISRFISFFIIVLIAKYLGDEGLGIYSYAFAFTGIALSVFADFGVNTYLVREISKNKNKTDTYFNTIISLKVILLVLSFFLVGAIAYFIDSYVYLAVLFALFAMIFDNLGYTSKALFEAKGKMNYYSITLIAERIVALLLGSFFLVRGFGIEVFMITFIVSYFISFIVSVTIIKKKILRKIHFIIDVDFFKIIIKKSLPFFFSSLFIMVYVRIDTVMLALMKNYAVVGWYNAAYRIERAIMLIPGIVISVIFPLMSKMGNVKKAVMYIYDKSFYYLFSLALPIAIGITLLASRIILFVYKEQFIHSILALQILIWGDIFIFVNLLMGYLLNSINKEKYFSAVTGVCVVFNITMNLILIPAFEHGYPGAAIATVLTEFVNFVMLFYFTSKFGFIFKLSSLLKPVLATVVMGLVVIKIMFMHLFFIISIGAFIYFAVLFLIKGFGMEELDLIKSCFRS